MKARPTHLALCAGMLWAGRARAAPGDATRLEYARSDRAARCPDQDALKSAVVQRLGYDPFFPAARQTIVVEITDVDAGLRAQMRLVDEQGIIRGSRELRDKVDNCSELVASLALAINIALDPSAALGEKNAVDAVAESATIPKKEAAPAQPESSAAPAVETPPSVATPHRDRPAKSPASGRGGAPSPFAVRAAMFGALGAAPSTALGARVGGSVRSDWFYFVAELADQFPASKSAPIGGKVQTSVLDLALLPCAAWHRLGGRGAFQMGSQRAEGSGVDNPVTQHSLDVSAGVRVELSPGLGRNLRLLVNADALKSLTPVTLSLLSGEVWRTPSLSVAAGLGLEWQIP